MEKITPEFLLNAYANGYFPMAETADSKDIHWFHPERRGVIPLDNFHTPKNLRKFLNKRPFSYTTNQCFTEVMKACAQREEDTWINDEIIALYTQLHQMGHAHSVEVWQEAKSVDFASPERTSCEMQEHFAEAEDKEPSANTSTKGAQRMQDKPLLVGGLYGVCLGGAFFGESMFSRTSNASKAALVHLVELLNAGGYTLLDAQYVNDHLKQFGIIEITREEYLQQLETALTTQPQNSL